MSVTAASKMRFDFLERLNSILPGQEFESNLAEDFRLIFNSSFTPADGRCFHAHLLHIITHRKKVY